MGIIRANFWSIFRRFLDLDSQDVVHHLATWRATKIQSLHIPSDSTISQKILVKSKSIPQEFLKRVLGPWVRTLYHEVNPNIVQNKLLWTSPFWGPPITISPTISFFSQTWRWIKLWPSTSTSVLTPRMDLQHPHSHQSWVSRGIHPRSTGELDGTGPSHQWQCRIACGTWWDLDGASPWCA